MYKYYIDYLATENKNKEIDLKIANLGNDQDDDKLKLKLQRFQVEFKEEGNLIDYINF